MSRMSQTIQTLIKSLAILFKPLLKFVFLRNDEKIFRDETLATENPPSAMVAEFNGLSDFLYHAFFRRVKIVDADLEKIHDLSRSGPIVFVTKNNGALEYRYFNFLFLKNNMAPVRYATVAQTLFWWPLKKTWHLLRGHLSLFYKHPEFYEKSEAEEIATHVEKGSHVLVNVKISRNYLFGLFEKNPMATLLSLLELQSKSAKNIRIVPIQFLYDKHPEKTQRSFFDFLFGEKSCPGTLRKFLLFLMNYKKSPQAKFGTAISLQEFVQETASVNEQQRAEKLLGTIEENLSIERARITGPKLVAKEAIIDEILRDPQFTMALEELALETKGTFNDISAKARQYLNEIAADVNYSYVHLVALVLNYLWDNIYDGVVIKHDQLNRIREIAGKNPIVLVPMHRSHIDYLLISHIFYNHNITFPHVCAGNNMNFWPIGRLVRKCGGFFIRRRLAGNHLYKESLFSYIKTLLKKSHCIEFYIEGTRSRTGKMLKPKFGILSQILRTHHEGACDDILFVPIAINYDQIIEQKSYRAESRGEEKKKENAAELAKVSRVISKKYGKVYIEFAPHLSLNDYLKEKNIDTKQPFSEMKTVVEDFGYHLTYLMNKAAIVTPVSLVALAIMSFHHRTFTLDEIIDRIHVFKDYLDYKEVVYSDLIYYSDRWAFNEALTLLKNKGLIREMKSFEGTFYTVENQNLVHLDYYKNNILHFFVSITCFFKTLSMVKNGDTITMNEIVRRYERLKMVFTEDFTFSSREPLENHLRRVMVYCESRGLITTDDDFRTITRALTPESKQESRMFSCLLDNFLESHLITLRYLKTQSLENVEKTHIIHDILEKARPLYLTTQFKHTEALTRFNLESSLKLCTRIGLLSATTSNREKTLYSTIEETSLVEIWIDSVTDLLTLSEMPVKMESPPDFPITRTVDEKEETTEVKLH